MASKFGWLRKTGQYIAKKTRQLLSRVGLARTGERVISLAVTGHLNPLAVAAAEQTISAGAWTTAMREEVKNLYISQYELGRGGIGRLTQSDYGRLGQMIKDQYQFLDGFAAYVDEFGPTEAYIKARAQLYANATREAFERGRSRAAEEAGMDEVSWNLTPAEHCDTCKERAAMGWQPMGPRGGFMAGSLECWPADGSTICLTNCKCELSYRNSKTGKEFGEGGPGSGHHGHKGVPGKRGGSAPGGKGGIGPDSESIKRGERVGDAIGRNARGRDDETMIEDETERITNELKDEFGDYDPDTFEQYDYSYVGDELYGWSEGSHGPSSLVLHAAAEQELGSPMSDFTRGQFHWDISGADLTSERRLLRNVYDNTQSELKGLGIDPGSTIVLYRGVAGKPGFMGAGRAKGNAIESWTTSRNWAEFYVKRNRDIAKEGYVLTAKVPASQILSLPHTGLGLPSVSEVVVLGGKGLDVYIGETF